MSSKPPWIIEGRAGRWGPGKVHYASNEQDILGLYVAECGTTSGPRQRGRHKDITCMKCSPSKE